MIKKGHSATESPRRSASGFATSPPARDSTVAGAASPQMADGMENVSPELSPIVTLLSAHAHRRYNEGIFMLLNDLTADGKPGDRKWEEVYGILTGTQLAVWDANKLSKYKDDPEKLITHSSKPSYINFTDSSFKAVDRLPSSNGDLSNVIVVSTTLKNRYLLQYATKENFNRWNASFRLATFEYTSLQEAYTGALLSARGSRLSDIRVILAETKYEHEDWVSVRFGSGMPWKRCYAVIEPSKAKKKFHPGKMVFYENEKKNKKTAMASITGATCCYAIYPQTPNLIDHSTLMKLEGTIAFHKSDSKNASVFLMPEQHYSVPGFDTIIRFLMPTLDAFGIYGRPKKLNADKTDSESLLFGLPVLPHVHYLEVEDVLPLASQTSALGMSVDQWIHSIKQILARKLAGGYTGCGSSKGYDGALKVMSPLSQQDEFSRPMSARQASPLTPSFLPAPFNSGSNHGSSSKSSLASSEEAASHSRNSNSYSNRNSNSNVLSEIYNKYSQIDAPSSRMENNLSNLSLGRSKLSDDDLPEMVKTPTENIFDPSFGDSGFDEQPPIRIRQQNANSSESFELPQQVQPKPVPAVSVTASSPTYEQPQYSSRDKQRVLSPYSEFHQQVNAAVGASPRRARNAPPPSAIDNVAVSAKPLPTPPERENPYLQQPPVSQAHPARPQRQHFEQRAPSHNIVSQKPAGTGLQQQPIRNVTPTGAYAPPAAQNPYGTPHQGQQSPTVAPATYRQQQQRVASPAAESFGANSYQKQQRVVSPAAESFAANPYQPQQQYQQNYRAGAPAGPRPMNTQQQQSSQPPQQRYQQAPHHGQQQYQQQYAPQQQQYQQSRQQYPPQQQYSQQQYSQPQQQAQYAQQYQQYPKQRVRKAPPPAQQQQQPQQQNPYASSNPYAPNNQYI